MYKVKGTLDEAYNCLTIGHFFDARRELMTALGLSVESRQSFSLYVRGVTALKYEQVLALQQVFRKYGIDWTFVPQPQTTTIKSKITA